MTKITDELGVVVIGRNEGERLKRCISSIQLHFNGPIIYVDSGSTDGSVEYCDEIGLEAIDLDMSTPFTMSRARNAGFKRLIDKHVHCKYVQFVDGDCELSTEWLATSYHFIKKQIRISSVCGILQEKFPDKNIYHRLMNMELKGHSGEIIACGGIAMFKIETFEKVGGFNESLIAGEEADLCLRIKSTGEKVWRLDVSMGTHDIDMHKFSQWWTRMKRTGHAYAQGFDMYGKGVYKHKQKQVLSSLIYGFIVPFFFIFSLSMLEGQEISITILILTIIIYIRVFLSSLYARLKLRDSTFNSLLYATAIIIGKFPEVLGIFIYYMNNMFGKTSLIMEYRDDK